MNLIKDYFNLRNEWLYVLYCESNKWYIGKSSNLFQRLDDHSNMKGAVWTTKYKPISLIQIKPLEGDFHEDLVVKEYMRKYGIDNVRGGAYSSTILFDYQIKSLQKEIIHASNCCFRCGKPGHMIKDCIQINANNAINTANNAINTVNNAINPANNTANNAIDNTLNLNDEKGNNLTNKRKRSDSMNGSCRCFKCGEEGHFALNCCK